MTDTHPRPPRWASALLRVSLRPTEVECVSGDLLEEYREARLPSLGRRRADAWYIKHALSVLWRLVWPFALAVVVFRVLSFPLLRAWNASLVAAPGVSLLDALILLLAGYYGAYRTGRVVTGIVAAGAVSVLGFVAFLVYASITMPRLLAAPFEKPFIFVILATLLAIGLAFGLVVGTVGAAFGRWLPSSRIRRIDVV